MLIQKVESPYHHHLVGRILAALDEARRLLTGASTATPPQHTPSAILDDILSLVYD